MRATTLVLQRILVYGIAVLMSVLGNNLLVGLPQNVRFLHIQQLEDFAPGRTILQEVLEADAGRVLTIREAHSTSTQSPCAGSDL